MKDFFLVGCRLRELRQTNKLSQEQLALRAEITPAYLGLIERGEKNPTIVIIEKLCRALNISLADFFSIDRSPSSFEEDIVLEKIIFELQDKCTNEKLEILAIIKHIFTIKDCDCSVLKRKGSP